ncbi:Transcription antitermination protein NusB [Koleobacter methoxysyntrophicus]|jgi:N utilization substance protein B|uniref:Transcription antitermination protein NusB n=1 Tax=Koleobacter methoxysyntrophicus TaxID=2751313 RepID=A0A8A0RRN9_9FIRM|nr:transcription antitermination factor NusB [Koleobacter methoxysyntrophicus]MDI3540783.1 transcription antitermination protein NusB [Thermosediminibacterales bacterium]MDK2901437.1 transcription antitermination protein NusB [Thermosediminibacterales bacterium]QSQ10047.1 Transcription antitermination protein NusB [Koleobacter methoxysyntrophicus]
MNRRMARENVLKILFEIDVGGKPAEDALADFFENIGINLNNVSDRNLIYIKETVEGTVKNRKEIDSIIEEFTIDWKLDRLANVDKNVLRFSIFEILFKDDIPIQATINEAVELTKKYNTEEAGKFVNGILGEIVKQLDKINKRLKRP